MSKLMTRETAEALGLRKYFTGWKCKNGHVAERYTGSRHCVACVEAQSSAWAKHNREKARAKCRRYYLRNRERMIARVRRRYWEQRAAATGSP
jgi:hypothetical protein